MLKLSKEPGLNQNNNSEHLGIGRVLLRGSVGMGSGCLFVADVLCNLKTAVDC
jgi:hypothetical protein